MSSSVVSRLTRAGAFLVLLGLSSPSAAAAQGHPDLLLEGTGLLLGDPAVGDGADYVAGGQSGRAGEWTQNGFLSIDASGNVAAIFRHVSTKGELYGYFSGGVDVDGALRGICSARGVSGGYKNKTASGGGVIVVHPDGVLELTLAFDLESGGGPPVCHGRGCIGF